MKFVRITRIAATCIALAGCAAPDSAGSYNRHNINSLYLVDYGRVIDVRTVPLAGTAETGAQVGGTIGAINAINRGTTSTESAVLRILGGALIGAAVENSMTQGEAFEYTIERRDGQLISLVNQRRVPIDACVLIRTNSATQQTSLTVTGADYCGGTRAASTAHVASNAGGAAGKRNAAPVLAGEDLYTAEQIAKAQECQVTEKLKDEGKLEVYSATCPNGSALVITCEWGNCRGL